MEHPSPLIIEHTLELEDNPYSNSLEFVFKVDSAVIATARTALESELVIVGIEKPLGVYQESIHSYLTKQYPGYRLVSEDEIYDFIKSQKRADYKAFCKKFGADVYAESAYQLLHASLRRNVQF